MSGELAMELNSNDKTIRVHLGWVAFFQFVIAMATALVVVSLAFGSLQAQVDSLIEWRTDHVAQQRTFEKDYRVSAEALIRTITKLETTVDVLAGEVSSLRKERKETQ